MKIASTSFRSHSLHPVTFSNSPPFSNLTFPSCNFFTINDKKKFNPLKLKFPGLKYDVSARKNADISSPFFSLKCKTEPMLPPYNVLITGSSKGIGYALAKEFLKAGDNVIISSRTAEHVDTAVQKLKKESGKPHVWVPPLHLHDI